MSTQAPQPPDVLTRDTVEARMIKEKIWDRLWLENEHFMAVVVGREGSGKSYTGIKLSEVVDPGFDETQVMFDPKAFLERLQDWKANGETQGKMVVIDEAGVGVGVRTWHDEEQIALNQTLQIIRDENMGVIFTLPRLEELDSQTEGRLHAYIEMTSKENGEWAKFKWHNWDPTRDGRNKIYRENPEMFINGHKRTVRRLCVSPPSMSIIEPYSERKDTFQNEQYQDAIDKMSDDVDDEQSVKDVAMEIADGKMDQYVSEHSQNHTPYINSTLIRADYEMSQNDSKAVKELLQRQYTDKQLKQYV